MGNHTPGPWSLERVPIQSRGGSNTCYKIGPFQCCIYDDWRPRDKGISEEENKANALLLAAAPELLEACELASRSVPHHPDSKLIRMLSAAIRKATQAHPQETQP